MSSWVILLLGIVLLSAALLTARKLGAVASESRARKRVIKAAEQRKAIDNEIQNLSPTELADRLRSGM